jgi:hypothetical protein
MVCADLQLTIPLFIGTITRQKTNRKKLEVRNRELQQSLITGQTKGVAGCFAKLTDGRGRWFEGKIPKEDEIREF